MRFAICLPSRGLINSQTVESILNNLETIPTNIETKWFISHNLPIPDAQNDVAQRAYDWKADKFLFVEEDNILPNFTLFEMLNSNYPVVTVDYAVGEKRYSTIRKDSGKISWCGLGCTLINRNVFDKLDRPWFRTNISYQIIGNQLIQTDVLNKYGGHDIDFGLRLKKLNIPIFQLPNRMCGHIKLKQLGRDGYNNGIHQFEVWDKIEHYQNF